MSPIFVAGADRSGIGLLGEVLECHPDVSMTRRTNFWGYYDGRFGDLAEPANVDRCLDAMAHDRRGRVFDPDRDRVHEVLRHGPASYERLFEALQEQLMIRRGCLRWGDKSLGSERHANRILSAYPSARMIQLLRDPRDRYASQKHHRASGRLGVGAGAALWRRSEQLATLNSKRFAGRYQVIRYEDLVGHPDATLGSVCRFLELDIVEQPSKLPDPQPFTSASVGRYLRDISRTDRRFIELADSRGMRRWGYAPGPQTLSQRDQLRFWVTVVPTHLSTGVLSSALATIRHHRAKPPRPWRIAVGNEQEGETE